MASREKASLSNLPDAPDGVKKEFEILAGVKWSEKRWRAMARVLTETREGKVYLEKLQSFGQVYRRHYQLRTLKS